MFPSYLNLFFSSTFLLTLVSSRFLILNLLPQPLTTVCGFVYLIFSRFLLIISPAAFLVGRFDLSLLLLSIFPFSHLFFFLHPRFHAHALTLHASRPRGKINSRVITNQDSAHSTTKSTLQTLLHRKRTHLQTTVQDHQFHAQVSSSKSFVYFVSTFPILAFELQLLHRLLLPFLLSDLYTSSHLRKTGAGKPTYGKSESSPDPRTEGSITTPLLYKPQITKILKKIPLTFSFFPTTP